MSHAEPAVSRAPPASAKTAQQVGAGLLATAACFGADAAVLMHVGVGFAFCAAACTGETADLQEGTGDVGLIAGVPGSTAPVVVQMSAQSRFVRMHFVSSATMSR